MMEASFRSTWKYHDIEVGSAGTRGTDGRAADPVTAEVAAERDLDLSEHRSRKLTRELVAAADVIVCAEVEHLLGVLDLDMSAFPKTFLLLELASRAAEAGGDPFTPEWLAKCHVGRNPSALMRSAGQFAILDPYKQGATKIAKAASQITDAIASITQSRR
jgi:protein-tyrosine-phosphatase